MTHVQISRFKAWKMVLPTAGVFCAVAGLLAHRAAAVTSLPAAPCSVSGAACGFAISDSKVQKVSPLFKLQAQISQAKIPVGDAVFTNLVVNLLSANTLKCKESFSNVKVRSGVLNLEIGRNIDCGQSFLDDVIGRYNDLAFQVCIGDASAQNCLKPVQMASVPYAIKANYASQAQNAYQAETASRANYARRLSADSNMLNTGDLGKGYFDAQAPDINTPGTGSSSALQTRISTLNPSSALTPSGGFFYWWSNEAKNSMNICGKSSTNDLQALTDFTVHAGNTNLVGKLETFDVAAFDQGFNVPANGGELSATPNSFTVSGSIAKLEKGFNIPANGSGVSATPTSFDVSGSVANLNKGFNVPASGSGISATPTSFDVSGGVANLNKGFNVPASGASISATTTTVTVNGAMTVNTGVTFAGAGTTTFNAGTTLDLRATNLQLPTTVVAKPAITAQIVHIVAGGVNPKSSAPVIATFCALTFSYFNSIVAGAAVETRGCSVQQQVGGQFVLALWGNGECSMTCF